MKLELPDNTLATVNAIATAYGAPRRTVARVAEQLRAKHRLAGTVKVFDEPAVDAIVGALDRLTAGKLPIQPEEIR